MRKSQFEQLVREVIRETIRKVDGKYVVYPEKGGKRLGTHSTKKAAEKQLTAIHLNKEAVEPNFDFEWKEATRYPEFKKLGKDKWIELAKTGKALEITSAKDINNTDANEPNAFKTLDPNKQKRALAQLKSGNVEMPIVALYSDGYKELVAGNTRLTAMMARNKKATIWQFEVPEQIMEIVDTDNMLTVLSVIDGKRNLANDQISQLFSDDVGGTFYIYTNEEGEYENLKPISRQEAYKYIDYYNARLKKDHKREEKLGAELGVLGIESELQFNRGEFKTDPSVFSVNEGIGADYLEKASKYFYDGASFQDTVDDGYATNPADVMTYIGEEETNTVDETLLAEWIESNNIATVKIAEYQYEEEKYNFKQFRGAAEYDSSILIYKMVDKETGQPVSPPLDGSLKGSARYSKVEPNKKYYYFGTTDRGTLGGGFPLLEEKHIKILKSIADIFEPSEVDENFKDGKKKGKSRPGRVKKAGASCKGSVTDLRAKAKKYGGEKGKMYHWCANMKGGKK